VTLREADLPSVDVNDEADDPADVPALVAAVNDPADLARARDQGWYRIPIARAPRRVAAEYLAFYQTGAFPPGERWLVRWMAPVRRYHLATRRELIPEEPAHPRADDRYYKVVLGPLCPLPRSIPSRRLRRITFIPTTLARLTSALEINDLWVKSSAQERLWMALRLADVEAERQLPLHDDFPQYVADFAIFCPSGKIAVLVVDEPPDAQALRDAPSGAPAYLLTAGGWTTFAVTCAELEADVELRVTELLDLVRSLDRTP
jgi:hypothetical protein